MALQHRTACWLATLACVIAVVLVADRARASVNWDGPVNPAVPSAFENADFWDAETYTPVPAVGNEEAPPGDNSIFFIGEGNFTVLLTGERSGNNGTEKLGTFSIGNGTFAPGTPNETTGPGDEVMTFILRNNVTFTGMERADDGTVSPTLRVIRIGRQDRQPKLRGDGQIDFPWGVVRHEAGLFRYDPALPVSSATELRIAMSDDQAGGAIFEVAGTASLNVIGKIRVGDRSSITSGAGGIFRIRGSTMGANQILADDLKVASQSGMWDYDRPIEYESRVRYNRGKSILEFVVDAGGVTPLTLTDALEIGDNETVPTTPTVPHPDAGSTAYTPGFLRVKLSHPLDVNATPGFVGQDPLVLVNADRIITTTPAVPDPSDPLQAQFLAGRFFDPDRDGPAIFADADPDPDVSPHRFLPSGGQVVSNYANATYTWTIEYFEDSNGADNGVVGSYVRLVDGVITGTPGDFNDDSMLTSADRDALVAAIASPPVSHHDLLGSPQHLFDLNADDFIDNNDLTTFNTYFLAPAELPGDYNDDGVVNAADYTIWRDHLGQNFQLENEVANTTPGMVTVEDYNEWKTRFGDTLGPGAGLGAGAVPEPGTVLLAALGMIGWLGVRRRAA